MGYRILCKFSNYQPQAALRHWKNQAWLLLAILASTFSSFAGCSAIGGAKESWHYSGMWNEMMMGYRNEAWANKAWHNRKHQFCREKHLHEFCEGFRAGYAAIGDGAEGCSPAFPPRQYWGWKYQSSEGQEKVAAWYAGFPHGARAADEDGIGNWTQIQSSTAIQHRFQEQGMLGPGQSPGMYPMPEAQPIGVAYAAKLKADGGGSNPAATLISEAPSSSDHSLSHQGQLLKK